MTVKELRERLERYNPDAKVYFFYFNDNNPNDILSFETNTVGIVGNNDHIMIDLLKPLDNEEEV